MPRKTSRPPLSRLEQSLMAVIWELGECTAADIVAEVNKERKLAVTTVHTVIANLRKKGYITRVPTVERSYRYKPTVAQDAVGRASLREVVTNLFGGSPKNALMCLIEDEDITDEDLDELRKLLKARKSGK